MHTTHPALGNGRKSSFLGYGRDPQYPSSVIPREHLSSYQFNYDDYKTELLAGLKSARECISERAEENRTAMKNSYDKSSSRRSHTEDVETIGFCCPETYMHHNQHLSCAMARPWGTIIPNAPIPELITKTPYELGRAITIAMQTHVSDAVKRDLLVDDSYVTLSPTGLAIAYAYFRGACMHLSQMIRVAQLEARESHRHRNGHEAFDADRVEWEALKSSILLKPWTIDRWSAMRCKRTIILLPAGFENHTEGFTKD
ncbi:unnamed protein product [Haemonchus placei]|uniref:Uncharacterized protein n=1 Tax=Haemonchus placei TaxID=6290 RepID=A0A0N4VWX8_HAEPC|nr:unnamed protein product [Haemonchus placei]